MKRCSSSPVPISSMKALTKSIQERLITLGWTSGCHAQAFPERIDSGEN